MRELAITGAVLVGLAVSSPFLAVLAQPWAPVWFGNTSSPFQFGTPGELVRLPLGSRITDTQRYQLARTVGFDPQDAVIAAAISIAENGSGDPKALSSTRDVGIWQINERWWAMFGGQQALEDPLRNAQAAFHIYTVSGWCAWYTYEQACGPRHRGTYRAYLERARLAVPGAGAPEGPLPADNSALMRAIQPWLGVPYLFGGCTRAGVDCSCFTQLVARDLGYRLPRTAQQQFDATERVSAPVAGDLVFFERTYSAAERITHVGWYVGDGMMISASEPAVGRQSLSSPFWRSRLVGYGRMRQPSPNQA